MSDRIVSVVDSFDLWTNDHRIASMRYLSKTEDPLPLLQLIEKAQKAYIQPTEVHMGRIFLHAASISRFTEEDDGLDSYARCPVAWSFVLARPSEIMYSRVFRFLEHFFSEPRMGATIMKMTIVNDKKWTGKGLYKFVKLLVLSKKRLPEAQIDFVCGEDDTIQKCYEEMSIESASEGESVNESVNESEDVSASESASESGDLYKDVIEEGEEIEDIPESYHDCDASEYTLNLSKFAPSVNTM